VATSFLVLPYGTGRSLLCTETRTATTDPDSARQFRRYWKIIGPFAGYIMRHWLTLAKQHAEQDQPLPVAPRDHFRIARVQAAHDVLHRHADGVTAGVTAGFCS
jgi:hypothetical protein